MDYLVIDYSLGPKIILYIYFLNKQIHIKHDIKMEIKQEHGIKVFFVKIKKNWRQQSSAVMILWCFRLLELNTANSSCKLSHRDVTCTLFFSFPEVMRTVRVLAHSALPRPTESAAAAYDIILPPRIVTPITKEWATCPVYRPVRSTLYMFPPSVSKCPPPGPAPSASPLALTRSVGDTPANGQLDVLVLAKTGALKNDSAASARLLIREWGFLSIWWHLRPLITEQRQVICMLMTKWHVVKLDV